MSPYVNASLGPEYVRAKSSVYPVVSSAVAPLLAPFSLAYEDHVLCGDLSLYAVAFSMYVPCCSLVSRLSLFKPRQLSISEDHGSRSLRGPGELSPSRWVA